jgi:transposase
MGKAKQISPEVRNKIINLSQHPQSTLTQTQIAEQCGVSQQRVSSIIKLHRTTGLTVPKPRTGRPKKTTDRTDKLILREVQKNPFITARQIKSNVGAPLSSVSLSTIKSRLVHKFDVHARKPVRKPLLTEKARTKRLAWCKKYKEWTVDMWKLVTFSDETMFLQFSNPQQFVRRASGSSAYDSRFTTKTVKHAPSVMVWGSFSATGRCGLYFLPKNQTMTAAVYTEMLESKHQAGCLMGHGTTVFQQDSAPCHTAKRSMKWFRDHNIQVLDWPGNSPDLNPIENLWVNMKRKVNTGDIQNMHQLHQRIQEAWCLEVTPEECEQLVESMPRRIMAVIKNKGYPTKY